MILDGLADGTLNGPQGVGGSGRMAISYMGAGEALVIILGDLGSKLIVLGI